MDLDDFGRFSNPALLILSSLAEGPKHGYSMMNDIEQMVSIRLGPGTLYGALARLEAVGFIQALPEVERRRPYRITEKGISALRAQLELLRRFTSIGLERLSAQKAAQ